MEGEERKGIEGKDGILSAEEGKGVEGKDAFLPVEEGEGVEGKDGILSAEDLVRLQQGKGKVEVEGGMELREDFNNKKRPLLRFFSGQAFFWQFFAIFIELKNINFNPKNSVQHFIFR